MRTSELQGLTVKELQKFGKVFISSGERLPSDMDQYGIKIEPNFFHDILSSASLVVTDSQTTTAEAGELGVPAVRCNSYVNRADDMSYIEELESRYGLVYSFNNPNRAIRKIMDLANRNNEVKWKAKKEKMLKDKIDVTNFIVWVISNYPESTTELIKGRINFENFQ